MAYEKYEWHKGEIITSDKLNNMENRIEEAASSGVSLKFVKDSEGSYEKDGETITYTGAVAEGLVGDDIPEEHRNKATGDYAHVEGGDAYFYDNPEDNEYHPNIASGIASHAEGSGTTASGYSPHAEGSGTTASGDYSHAEGDSTTASGEGSHAEGSTTTASGNSSHAEGLRTIANHQAQHVFGKYNIEDPSTDPSYSRGTYVEIVGNGTGTNTRSNARTLDWSGNMWLAGSLSLGNTTITEAQLQSLLALLNT